MGGEPVQMLDKALEALGGIEKYVKKGQKVVIKPNIAWDKTPELAANTNPELVAAMVKKCLAAGAKEVVVFDHTCDNWKASVCPQWHRRSGQECRCQGASGGSGIVLRGGGTAQGSEAQKDQDTQSVGRL